MYQVVWRRGSLISCGVEHPLDQLTGRILRCAALTSILESDSYVMFEDLNVQLSGCLEEGVSGETRVTADRE